ncbi:MAG TPA: hypothetical protein PKE55_02905 [Kiritimatiellia bacterium]|nr:hypothetical protein [Kiritimatiellia bacterium]
MNRWRGLVAGMLAWMVSGVMTTSEGQTRRERGLGPFTVVTPRGEFVIRLLRREGDFIWVDRLTREGVFVETGMESGIAIREIVRLVSDRPPLFELAEQPVESMTEEQLNQIHNALRTYAARFRPYRDIPGIRADEATRIQAGLYQRQEMWRDAYLLYRDLLTRDYRVADRETIQLRAGLCLWRMEQKERAIPYLTVETVPDEDLYFMSEVFLARADALTSVGRYRESLEDLLRLIVFYPFTGRNEARSLLACIPNYVGIHDWDAAYKTLMALDEDYPDQPETEQARALLARYQEELEKEQQFQP